MFGWFSRIVIYSIYFRHLKGRGRACVGIRDLWSRIACWLGQQLCAKVSKSWFFTLYSLDHFSTAERSLVENHCHGELFAVSCISNSSYLFCVLRIHFHKGHPDPLGWTCKSSVTVHQFTTRDITQLVQNVPHTKASVLIVDSLSFVLRHHQPVVICQRLQELKKGERLTPETLLYWRTWSHFTSWVVLLIFIPFPLATSWSCKNNCWPPAFRFAFARRCKECLPLSQCCYLCGTCKQWALWCG